MIARLLDSIKCDKRGAAVLELALVAPILALMTIGVVDLSNGFGRKLVLEQAAQRAIEKVMQTTGTDTVEATIVNEAASQANVPAANVQVIYRLECNAVLQIDYDAECSSGHKEARYILVTVTDTYEPMFPIHFKGLDANGVYNLSASSGLRTQ